jgi:hypothetical protein
MVSMYLRNLVSFIKKNASSNFLEADFNEVIFLFLRDKVLEIKVDLICLFCPVHF